MIDSKIIVWNVSNFRLLDNFKKEDESIIYLNTTPSFDSIHKICSLFQNKNIILYFTSDKKNTIPTFFNLDYMDILLMNKSNNIQYGSKVVLDDSTTLCKLYSSFPTFDNIILSPKMVDQICAFKNKYEYDILFYNSITQNIYSLKCPIFFHFEPNLFLFFIILWITYFCCHYKIFINTIVHRQKKFPSKGITLSYHNNNTKYEILLNLYLYLVQFDCKNCQIIIVDQDYLYKFIKSYDQIWKKWNIEIINNVSMIQENSKIIQLNQTIHVNLSNIKNVSENSFEIAILRFCYKNNVQYVSQIFIMMNPLFSSIQELSITEKKKLDWSFLEKLSMKKSLKFNKFVLYKYFIYKNFYIH